MYILRLVCLAVVLLIGVALAEAKEFPFEFVYHGLSPADGCTLMKSDGNTRAILTGTTLLILGADPVDPDWVEVSIVGKGDTKYSMKLSCALTSEEKLDRRTADLVKAGFSKKEIALILDKKVQLGCSTAVARESWGDPEEINKTTTSGLISEQWVYPVGDYKFNFLYFENGVLVTIQN